MALHAVCHDSSSILRINSPQWALRRPAEGPSKCQRDVVCEATEKRGRLSNKARETADEKVLVEDFGRPKSRETLIREEREARRVEGDYYDNELADWTQRVVDWKEFEENDFPGAGFGGDDRDLPWGNDMRARSRMAGRQLRVLREDDPNFISSIPLENRKVYPDIPLPEAEPLAFAPDSWGPWDFRAHVEKQKRIRKERAEWIETQRQIGRFQYMHVDETTDNRLQSDWDEPKKQWTNEEIFNLITNNGNNALPSDVVVSVENPKTKADLQQYGGEYHESNEEFLERTGRLLHADEPTQADMTEAMGIDSSNLMSDFEGLDASGFPETSPSNVRGVEGDNDMADNDVEDPLAEGLD